MRIGLTMAMVAWAMAGLAEPGAGSAVGHFPKMPSEATALRVTRGKPFRSGLVFVDGKYIAPPYVVERYGTVIRINSVQVTGQIIPWTEFLRTQEGVKQIVETPAAPEIKPEPKKPEPKPAPVETKPADDDDELNDLFEDEVKPEPKKPDPKPAPEVKPEPKPVPPKPIVRYELSGEFKPNGRTVEMVAKINRVRQVIDERLRKGNVIFFGSRYSRVMGDSVAARKILETLPECQRSSSSPARFISSMRARNLTYLPDLLLEDLYRHRVDYPRLQEHRRELSRKEDEWNNLLDPSF